MAESQCNAEFKTLIKTVLQRFDGATCKDFVPESFSHFTRTGVTIERPYIFYSKSDFQKAFQVDGTSLGLPLACLRDERGAQLSGFLLADDSSPELGLKVRLHHSMYGSTQEHLQDVASQLRAGQSQEFASSYMSDARSLLPKGLSKPGECIKVSKIPEMKAHFLKAKAEAEELAAAAAALTTQPLGQNTAPPEKPDENKVDEEEEEESEVDVQPSLLQSQQAKVKKAKGKGKGKRARPSLQVRSPKAKKKLAATGVTANSQDDTHSVVSRQS